MIKVLFVVLLLSTAAVVAVGIAIYLRVRRHLETAHPEAEVTATTAAPVQDDNPTHFAGASEEISHGKSSDGNT